MSPEPAGCAVLAGDGASEPPHQRPPLREELGGLQHRHILLKEAEKPRPRARTEPRGGTSSLQDCTCPPPGSYIIVTTLSVQPKLSLRELGLSELGERQLDELVNLLLPRWSPQDAPFLVGGQTVWRTSHMSTHSFFWNKHGEPELLFQRCYREANTT